VLRTSSSKHATRRIPENREYLHFAIIFEGNVTMSEYFLGMDLGGTNVAIGLLDSQGKMIARDSQPTQVELGPEALVSRVAAGCAKLIEKNQLLADQIKAAGIGTPGPLSIAQGKIIKAGNLPGFDNFRLRGELSGALNIPAVLDNDANAACWGEFWLGAGKDIADMIMFTLGTGIGGGIVCAGELIHGSLDNAAELGHMIIEPGGRLCTCGQLGCLEAYASASQTAKRAQEAIQDGRNSAMQKILDQNGEITCKDVFDCAKDGDKLASEIIDGTARALAVACVNMNHITEPDRVVLTGGMIHAGDILLDKVRKLYREMMWKLNYPAMEICFAQLGDDAGVIGAAGLALHAHQQGTLSPVGN
jgi:glucokinase